MDKIGDIIKIKKCWYDGQLKEILLTGVHKITHVYSNGAVEVTLENGERWSLNRHYHADWITISKMKNVNIYDEVR